MRQITQFLNTISNDVQKAIRPRLAFNASIEGDSLDILVHGVIGDEWDGLDSRSIVSSIKGFKGDSIHLDINTPGGSVFDAMSAYDALVRHDATVTADITGAAFSAGTILASAGDLIRINQGAPYMIHRAWAMAVGNAPVMIEAAQMLERADLQISELLAERSGNSVEDVTEWMVGNVDGTEFTAQEAVDKGFADEVLKFKGKPAPKKTGLRQYYDTAAQIEWARLKNARM